MANDSIRRSNVAYLDDAASSEPGREYKHDMFGALDVRPGQVVVDVGCGPGTDLASLADRVGPHGSVLGIDADPAMIAEAHRRHGAHPQVQVREGDAHTLPLPDSGVDRVRMDRVTQHLSDPVAAFAEVFRVMRPGGLFVVADPDWDTLVIDDVDVETSRAYTRFVANDVVRNGTIGRQLARLAVVAGFELRSVRAVPILFTDAVEGERILGFRRVMARAVQAGAVAADVAEQWLRRRDDRPFVASFTFFVTVAQRPHFAV